MANTSEVTPRMLTETIRGRRAWRRHEVGPGDWTVRLPPRCVDELDAVAGRLSGESPAAGLPSADRLALAACAELMADVRARLLTGIGLVVLDRVPVERYSLDENRALCWLLGQLLGRPVAQKWDGTVLYDVRDTGKALEYGVRRSVTNLELAFHTDAAWLERPPELVGLYCINPALEGGVSRFVSLCTVHNELGRRHRALLPRLYRPFPWDRQAEHAPGDDKTATRPIFHYDGRALVARVHEHLIANGAALAGVSLDADGCEALGALREVVGAPDLAVELRIERGQVQYLDNRQFAHSRTDFRDAPEPHRKRHLVRIWTREEGPSSFEG
jgi:alpha-ketoglutarate-dependent taurine dioxygenase